MARASQLKALLMSHLEGDDDRFYSVAMQVAAHEAKLGHGKLAIELRELIDKAKQQRGLPEHDEGKPIPISRPRGELKGLLEVSHPKTRLGGMVLGKKLSEQLNRVILEQRHASRILGHGLAPRRKLLLVGPPGTGKTMTASVLAGELGLALLQVRLDNLFTKFMGETAAKLRQVFDATSKTRGVFFFDEFDAIGSQRGLINDVGEMRRILNSFLQMIEQDRSHSLVVAATNHPDLLDSALYRRFDDVLHYELPDKTQISKLLKTRLLEQKSDEINWWRLGEIGSGLSYAEIARVANEVLKDALIDDRAYVVEADIRSMLEERKDIAERSNQRK